METKTEYFPSITLLTLPHHVQFTHPMPAEMEQEVAVLLQQLQVECCREGAWVENKGVLLTFHYRNVAKDKREPLVAR